MLIEFLGAGLSEQPQNLGTIFAQEIDGAAQPA
jgi:hypothetical protein